MELFAHQGVTHKTYLEATLHYLQDRWLLVTLVAVVCSICLYVGLRQLTNSNSKQYLEKED